MIQIPYEQILQKIKEATSLPDTEIQEKINEKLKQLSGLISKEGAAHIIANQLGVKLFEKTSGRLEIRNILVGMRDVETVGKVLSVYEVREFQTQSGSGKVGSFLLSDQTGTIRVVVWGGLADTVKDLRENTVIKIQNGYVKSNNGRKEVHLNDRSKIQVTDEAIAEKQIARKAIKDIADTDESIELVATIVQVFDPHFFEICPQCGRRARLQAEKFACDQHGPVDPAYSYVMNVFVDDGTGTIRVVCFRNQAVHLTGKSHEDILAFRGKPELFEAVKTELLGNITRFVGHIKSDEQFGRRDFMAEQVYRNVDPQDELKRMDAQVSLQEEEPVQ